MNLPVSDDALVFWAKTPDRDHAREATSGEWLSLFQHMCDAADVAGVLAEMWITDSLMDLLAREVAGSSGGSEGAGNEEDELVKALASWCGGVHDIGKTDLAFQSQLAKSGPASTNVWLWDRVRARGIYPDLTLFSGSHPRHASMSDAILRLWLRDRFPEASHEAIVTLTSIAGTHHGTPSDMEPVQNPMSSTHIARALHWIEQHGPRWKAAVWELLDYITNRTGAWDALESVLANGGFSIARQFSVAGLVTVADWIASDQNLFPLTESGRHSSMESRAFEALERLQLTEPWRVPEGSPVPGPERFGWEASAEFRPCQRAVIDALSSDESTPRLLVVSAETGEGKTEAALIAAEMLAGQTGLGGVAFALPSMATADAIFSRSLPWVRSVAGADGSMQSVFLGHSRAALNSDYEHLQHRVRSVETDAGSASGVVAHEWLCGRRRGILSNMVVCTVDQVLMLALASRYVTLRHLGLAGKVIVIDEVHSFDAYTSSYMERTLEWLGAHGASVVLLSATLASTLHAKFVEAFQRGLAANDEKETEEDPEDEWFTKAEREARGIRGVMESQGKVSLAELKPPFPFVSVTGAASRCVVSFEPREGHRPVSLTLMPDSLDAVRQLLVQARDHGGVVGVVCNTVGRAQEVYKLAQVVVGAQNAELIHAQFTAHDRADREHELVNTLGPKASRSSERPHLRVVVGTQVLEQSLDIDFDVLITDIAPVDLLAQRAGRLHRHARPAGDRPAVWREPRVYVRGITSADNDRETTPATDAAPHFPDGTEPIYGRRVLLATVAELNNYLEGGEPWCLRHDVAPLIEAVYAGTPRVPQAWSEDYKQASAQEAHKAEQAQRKAKVFQLLSPKDSRGTLHMALSQVSPSDAEVHEMKAQAHVRDIEPTLEVILVRKDEGGIRLLPEHGDANHMDVYASETEPPPHSMAKLFAASVVRLPRKLVPPRKVDGAIEALEKAGIPGWQRSPLLKGELVLVVNDQLEGALAGTRFRYSSAIGIEVLDEK